MENSFLRIIPTKPTHYGLCGSEHTEVNERQDEQKVGVRGCFFYFPLFAVKMTEDELFGAGKNDTILNPWLIWILR